MEGCIHINPGKAILILLSVLMQNVPHTQMADNHMHLTMKDYSIKNFSLLDQSPASSDYFKPSKDQTCSYSKDKECNLLGKQCMHCHFNESCIYGKETEADCAVDDSGYGCKGEKKFKMKFICRYCYQTEPWEHTCDLKANCNSIATTRSPYTTNCTVHDNILCLGHRTFNKNVYCNWTGGYRWSTALILSITLGGFGADRFYLGHWQEGIGKLFSFGGLGVWTLIDVILISLHYVGPADGSLYI